MGQNTRGGSIDLTMVQSYGAAQQQHYHSEQVFCNIEASRRNKLNF